MLEIAVACNNQIQMLQMMSEALRLINMGASLLGMTLQTRRRRMSLSRLTISER